MASWLRGIFSGRTEEAVKRAKEQATERARRFVSYLRNPIHWIEDSRNAKDLTLRILGGEGLPRTDFVGHSDPYVILTVGRTEEGIEYKTTVAYNTGNPSWPYEELHLVRVYPECRFRLELYDKDQLSADDFVAHNVAAVCMADLERLGPPGTWTPWTPTLQAPNGTSAGSLRLELLWTPSREPRGPMLHRGPARYRIALSQMAGSLLRSDRDGWGGYAAYKIRLTGIRLFFPEGDSQPWNRGYVKAAQIFNSPLIMAGIKSQHSLLYADTGKQEHQGILRTGADLMQLLEGGVRGGQRRYYTYTLLEDSLRFSETGAAFLADMMSKHAMHANCAEKVVYAGEFCVSPSPSGDPSGRLVLVMDNNSGTYAPPKERLAALRDLMCYNLEGLEVQVLSADDPSLAHYHSMAPSRLAPA